MPPSSSLTVGFIGAGHVAQALARPALAAGHRVILSNRRGPETLVTLIDELGPAAAAGTREDVMGADIVVLAVGWDQVPEAVAGLPAWDGQIVVDTTNQWHHHDPNQPADLGESTGSEYIGSQLQGARVVKAFNTVFMRKLTEELAREDRRLVIFLAGDDAPAKATVSRFIASLGLAPIDLGALRDGGRLMQAGGPLIATHLTAAA